MNYNPFHGLAKKLSRHFKLSASCIKTFLYAPCRFCPVDFPSVQYFYAIQLQLKLSFCKLKLHSWLFRAVTGWHVTLKNIVTNIAFCPATFECLWPNKDGVWLEHHRCELRQMKKLKSVNIMKLSHINPLLKISYSLLLSVKSIL